MDAVPAPPHDADEDFARRTAPHRAELLAHCYRMTGSAHDAEDLVQETLLRAWRAFDRYDEHRASLRTWLFRIATNACLTALEGRRRRPLPAGLGAPAGDPGDDPHLLIHREPDVPWLQPLPGPYGEDPADVLVGRRGLRLAFVAALQLLPPRQRAVLILRDVLDHPAAEVAAMLDATVPAVNSSLQRARARLGRAGVTEDEVDDPADPADRAVVDRYAAAFEASDFAGLARLLADEAILEMPPSRAWFLGRAAYRAFLERTCPPARGRWRMVPLTANAQPALAAYRGPADAGSGPYLPHSIQVFTTTPTRIARTTAFIDPALFAAFRLPPSLPQG
ncbi:RNA polymerase subunit sigma-70 [Mangrovactinospora gilvigrisea]|uniref:RNA polymerase sigma factor n=2 Tax=Mangrovactinospora gilvigrisea TaxID=1428644 RepID=A0A1J7C8G9_9ACTN|nr:RNA polymerase subunit sigma-70 [Mangrovactinospora gilvigrisea]